MRIRLVFRLLQLPLISRFNDEPNGSLETFRAIHLMQLLIAKNNLCQLPEQVQELFPMGYHSKPLHRIRQEDN